MNERFRIDARSKIARRWSINSIFQSKRPCSTEQVRPRERSKRNALPLSLYHVQSNAPIIEGYPSLLTFKISKMRFKTRIDSPTVLMWCLANRNTEIKRPPALYSLKLFLDARSRGTLIYQ